MNRKCPRLFDNCYCIKSIPLDERYSFTCLGINDEEKYRYCYKDIPQDIIIELNGFNEVDKINKLYSDVIKGEFDDLPFYRLTELINKVPYIPSYLLNSIGDNSPSIYVGIGHEYLYNYILNNRSLFISDEIDLVDINHKDYDRYLRWFTNGISDIDDKSPKIFIKELSGDIRKDWVYNLTSIWKDKNHLYHLLIKTVMDTLVPPNNYGFSLNKEGDLSLLINNWFDDIQIDVGNNRHKKRDIASYSISILMDGNGFIHPDVFLSFYSSIFNHIANGLSISNSLVDDIVDSLSKYALSKVYNPKLFLPHLSFINHPSIIHEYLLEKDILLSMSNHSRYKEIEVYFKEKEHLRLIREMESRGVIYINMYSKSLCIPKIYQSIYKEEIQ